MGIFLRDLRHAFRILRQSLTFSATAVAALVVGIGMSIAIFSGAVAALANSSECTLAIRSDRV
jgi:hypothetical protein